MTSIISKCENAPSIQQLGELTLWSPPQGTIPEMVPIEVDITFGEEMVQTPKAEISVSATSASITLVRDSCNEVRHSRYGELVHEPYVTAEILSSAQYIIENDQKYTGGGSFGFVKSIYGSLTATWSAKYKHSNTSENSDIVKAHVRRQRVTALPKERWKIVEPNAPNRLRGKYLGEKLESLDGEKSDPLCYVSLTDDHAKIEIYLTVSPLDLVPTEIRRYDGLSLGGNKKIIISELVRRSVSKANLTRAVLIPQLPSNALLIGHSTMEIERGA